MAYTPEEGGMQFGGNHDARLRAFLETAFMEGGQDRAVIPSLLRQVSRQQKITDPLGAANQILSQRGMRPFASQADYAARNTALPGHNRSISPFNPLDAAEGTLGGVGGLMSNEGMQVLGLAAGAGGLMGAGGAGSAAAGGSALPGNATIMGMGAPISGAELTSLGFDPLMASLSAAPYAAASAVPGAQAGGTGLTTPAAGGGTLTGGGVVSGGGVSGAGAAGAGAASGLGGISSLLSSPVAMGIGAGALLGGMGGSQQAGSITVEEGIPDWLQPYVKPQLDRYSTELQNYQTDPYGVMPAAMKEFQNTISGQYLDPSTNKYLEDYFRLGSERVKGSLSPSFGHMQAFGQHSGYNEALSRGLGDLAVGLYGGAYEKERDRQSQMTAAAPSFIGQSGTAAFAPYQQYLQSVGSLGKKKDQPYFENPFGNALGGAFLGGSLGNMFK